MTIKFAQKFKIPLVILGLFFLSFLLYNYEREIYFYRFFLGSKNRLVGQNKNERAAEIAGIIKSVLKDKPGRYAVFAKDLKSGESFEIASNETFGTASIYKLAVMYKTYDLIEKDELKKEDLLSAEKIILDRIIEGEENNSDVKVRPLRTKNGGMVSLTVENALNAMITISDNYSALLLAQRLGWVNIDKFLKEQNVQDFNFIGKNTPNVTANAIGNLLERIYSNTAINTKYSKEMKNLLFAQKVNDRIPKYLPDDIKVGHKTGELGSIRHDAGIVIGKNSHYIFVFLTDTPKPDEATETIALLSSKIFILLESNDYTD